MFNQACYNRSERHVMDSFKFESGKVLEDVTVEYITVGTPKYDDDGNIVNAVIFSPTIRGGHYIFFEYQNPFDKFNVNVEDYFAIRIFHWGLQGLVHLQLLV